MKNKKALLLVMLILVVFFSSCVSSPVDNSSPVFKLTFDANGGEFEDGNQTYVIETDGTETVELPDNPAKEDYKFVGWYLDMECTEPADELLSKQITDDVTVYAKWRELKTFTVTFDTFGEGYIEPITVKEGNLIPLPEEPVKTGYTFVGWYLDWWGSRESAESLLSEPITSDITLYANWTANKYKVTLDVCGGDPLNENPVEVMYEEIYNFPVPTREGYIFKGWYTAKENGTQYTDWEGTPIHRWYTTYDTTLYAVWMAI